MGTYWQVQWLDETVPTVSVEQLETQLNAELDRLNGLMSTWDPQSQLSRFNASDSTQPVALHSDTLEVIDTALVLSLLTRGRYDITLQPVIDLWGFGSSEIKPTPTQQQITSALQISGHALLERQADTLSKRHPDVSIDVSSLGKGFAVDKLGELVESYGVANYLIDIGGELRARGHRADGQSWKVGLENPDGDVDHIIVLSNTQIATSGSYRNYRVEQGKRLSHIIDGQTGRPIEHNLVSVSVIHNSTMLADAWATALMIVGEPDARKLIARQGLDAQLIVVRDNEFIRFASTGFAERLVQQ